MDITQERIERLFGESVYEHFKTVRYGIKSCKKVIDPICLWSIKELYYHKKEKFDCGEDSTECSYKRVKELINTL